MSSKSNSQTDQTKNPAESLKAHLPASLRHPNRRTIVVFVVVALIIIFGGYYLLQALIINGNGFTLSGTIEATEVHLGSEVGGIVDRINVGEGDRVEDGAVVAVVHGDYVRSPISGVVLERVAEPGEVIPAYSTLVTVADLESLTLTVYAPEDRYGQIILGKTYPLNVDSYPGKTFQGTVTHIADKAEFTPRNVQTTESRKSTVFAIKLTLEPSDGMLKPGMPADVHFQNNR